MSDNRQIILPGRHHESRLLLFRNGGRITVEFDDGYGSEVGMVLSEEDLARLRTWLNTGISPSRIDLVDPVPDVVVEKSVATFDPQPRDLRTTTPPATRPNVVDPTPEESV